jgi:hypothetical protein
VAPLVCDSLDATAARLSKGLGRKSKGEPGGEMKPSKQRTCVGGWVCLCVCVASRGSGGDQV